MGLAGAQASAFQETCRARTSSMQQQSWMTRIGPVACRTGLPTSQEANLILLQKRPQSWLSKFHELFDHITPDQWSFPHGVSQQLPQ